MTAQSNRQAIKELGIDNCRPLILNALKQAVDVSTDSRHRISTWQLALKELGEENWFGQMVLSNWYREDKTKYDQSIKQMKRLSFLLDEADGKTTAQTVDVEALKEQTDMTVVAQQYMKLHRSGSHFRGLCPHHKDTHPSYHMFKDHGHCFSCGAHDDVISFVQQVEGCSFREALRVLGGNV